MGPLNAAVPTAQKESELGNFLNQLEGIASKAQNDIADLQEQLSPLLSPSGAEKELTWSGISIAPLWTSEVA